MKSFLMLTKQQQSFHLMITSLICWREYPFQGSASSVPPRQQYYNNQMILKYIILLSLSCSALSFSDSNFHRLQLHGNISLAYYYLDLYIGSPPQHQTMMIDTGSSLSVLPCSACRLCKQQRLQTLYNSERSFSSATTKCSSRESICSDKCKRNNENCQFFVNYQDGSSVIGDIMQDKISFNDKNNSETDPFKAYFGCIDFEKYTFPIKANGLLGLGPQPSQTIFYKWFGDKPGREEEFSVCLSSLGGYFELGRSLQPFDYDLTVKYDSRYTHFEVFDVSSIKFGNVNLLNKQIIQYRGIIIDTGATYSYLPTAQAEKLKKEIAKICSRMKKGCMTQESLSDYGCFVFNFTSKAVESRMAQLDANFPKMLFDFNGQQLEWLPRHIFYIEEQSQYGTFVCSRIKQDNQNNYILGDTWLQGRRLTFNLKEQTISILSNQSCKYEPYLPKALYSDQIYELITSARELFQQYAIVVIAVAIFLLICLKNKINLLMVKLKRAMRKVGKKKNELNEEESVRVEMGNQITIINSTTDQNHQQNLSQSPQVQEIK